MALLWLGFNCSCPTKYSKPSQIDKLIRTETCCLIWDPDSRKFREAEVELKIRRYGHFCWKTEQGILLIGGGVRKETDTSEILTKTELVSFDGKSSEFGFNVKYEMGGFGLDVGGCGIDLEDGRYVVIGTV